MTDLIQDIADYYTGKLEQYGVTPRGVDWNGEDGQRLRFAQLARLLPDADFSLNDLGCGYGALCSFLAQTHDGMRYTGYDVSPAMVAAARAALPASSARVIQAGTPTERADFTVASGIFNVRMSRDAVEWQDYILTTIKAIDAASDRGFAFNCLTSYSDPDRMRPDLHYADPLALFDHCKRHYSRDVALLHDYGLWEFTILVRKAL